MLDKITKILSVLATNKWVSFWCFSEDKEAANQLVSMGLAVLETQEPKESGDPPIGAWKLRPGVQQIIIDYGSQQLLSKLGDAVLKQLENAPLK